ncbi:MAG TPA: type II secretion system protein N [Rhodocyclaceae bacterium]|nr:type II secretion system protein N [Rhodocyclaceae bacterium]
MRPNLRFQPAQLLVACAWLLALALTAWILAGWYWRLSSTPVQSARPSPVSDPAVAAQDIASRQLFGLPASALVAASNVPPPSLVVIGVSTRWGQLPGFAIIKDGNAPANSFVEGDEIATGIKLIHVRADAIEVDRNGVRETIALNAAARPASDAPPQTRPNQPVGTSAPAADN